MGVTDILQEVDHISGVCWDNRKTNLRVVDKQKNQMNAGKRVDNKSGTKGVYWGKHEGKWKAYIQYKNERYILGSHENKEDAIRILEIAELKFVGEYSSRYDELKEKYKTVDLSKYNFT
jgi:hypothetical protein